jgi:hypothetical protein
MLQPNQYIKIEEVDVQGSVTENGSQTVYCKINNSIFFLKRLEICSLQAPTDVGLSLLTPDDTAKTLDEFFTESKELFALVISWSGEVFLCRNTNGYGTRQLVFPFCPNQTVVNRLIEQYSPAS